MAGKNNKINRININEFIDYAIIARLKKIINKKRFLHSLSVAKISILLAEKFKVNLKKAAIAGLLHDCAKTMPHNLAKKYLKILKADDLKKENSAIWLPYIGYLYANDIFKIKNKEILNAIKYHTVGHKKMQKLAKIIYVADYFAHDRKFISNKILVNFLKKNISLDKLVLFVLKEKIYYLLRKQRKIHIEAIKLYNSLL
ncbi:MAG: bis(5'-nucleosyl)-tetraphosphatase (symmetrical) YqeK [Candidatus Goldbacteria bacterium]|nr:bis(5'-nucleosyl)-tetraphosphatase (symmetrical) YqeK [Candidatus Goldiibacteriota bacterium]